MWLNTEPSKTTQGVTREDTARLWGLGPGTLQMPCYCSFYGGCVLTQVVHTLRVAALRIAANLGPFSKEFCYDVLLRVMVL